MFQKDVNFVYEIPDNSRDVPKYVVAVKDHADVLITCAFSWFYKIKF